jgi:acetyl-CoA carboxylase biotin carboxyl carrier protein
MEIKDIEQIVRLLKQNDVTEFELEKEGTRVKLSRSTGVQISHSEARFDLIPAVQGAGGAISAASGASQADDSGRYVKVESPIVGTFYRRPSPDSEAFVKEGDIVSKGATLCIIEAMKLMNEIEATTSGRVVKILSTEGEVVEFGEVLFLIDPAV